jgi:hypothetical protein
MAVPGPSRATTAFAAVAAALVTTYFVFIVFAGWVLLQYGVKRPEFGWQVKRLGGATYVASVTGDGPAAGSLQPGDRVITVNGRPVETEAAVSLALRSVAGSSLYTLRVLRAGAERDVWLRSGTTTGVGFFRERLPLLGTSMLLFLGGLVMLLNWNNTAARLGFVAALIGALRMGAWALLPLTSFFSPQEFRPYFVFWLPVVFGLPLAYQSLLHFPSRFHPPPHLVSAQWVLYGAAVSMLAGIAYTGGVPAPVPEGLAYVRWNGVDYQPDTAGRQYGVVALLALTIGASAAWTWFLYRRESGDLRRRALWMLGTGAFFVTPCAFFEILAWFGGGDSAVRHSWLLGCAAIAYAYLVTADRVMHPATVTRGFLSTLLPERLFVAVDSHFFKNEANIEKQLRRLLGELSACTDGTRLEATLTDGVQEVFHPQYLGYNPEMDVEDALEVGPKRSGEPYTRRERRLLLSAVRQLQATERALNEKKQQAIDAHQKPSLNLLRECPRCGACYGSETVRCPADGAVPVVTLPIEPLIEGKYKLERLLGRGGMGAVYAGRDLRLNRRIAIKVMLSELFGHQGALRRFEREAQAAARLNHPNVVQIYDYGPIGAMGAFLVMEHIDGRSWREELSSFAGPIPAATCLPWIEQLLDGIQAAHIAGIVHRDLKPENLLLAQIDSRLQVKILDFGLAKMQLLNFSREEKLSLGITTIGTVGYVPPEQLSGSEADERSDIYALGRIIIETLTGELPEEGVTGVPAPVADVLARCVAHRKDDRYGCVADLRSELLPALAACDSAFQI